MQKINNNNGNNNRKKSVLGFREAGVLVIGTLLVLLASSNNAAFATTTTTTPQKVNSTGAHVDNEQHVAKSGIYFKSFLRDYSNGNYNEDNNTHNKDSIDNGNTVAIINNNHPAFEHSTKVLNEILQNTEATTNRLKEIDQDTDHMEKTTDATKKLVDERTKMLSDQISQLKDSAGIDKARYNRLVQELNDIKTTNVADRAQLLNQIDNLKEQVQQSQQDLQKAITDSNKSIKNKVEDSESDTVKKINAHTDDAFANFKQWFLDMVNAALAYVSQHMNYDVGDSSNSK